MIVAKDMRPFSFVSGEGFKEFTELAVPTYTLPSRQTLSKVIIPKLTKEEKDKVKEDAKNAEWVAITTDEWTSRTTTAFLGVTLHFVKDGKIVSRLLDCARDIYLNPSYVSLCNSRQDENLSFHHEFNILHVCLIPLVTGSKFLQFPQTQDC